jgi:predicted RNase H-like nuclease (RuvC/YqgF family)
MSNIYIPDSVRNHPAVKRLEERIAELELENKELKEQKEEWVRDYFSLQQTAQGYSQISKKYQDDSFAAQKRVKDLEEQIKSFNQLSFIRKATFHFRID